MESLRNYISNFSPISDKSWSKFRAILKTRKYPEGKVLTRYNSHPIYVFYSKKGFARAYSIDKSGDTFNIILYPPNRFMASLSSLLQNTRANLEVQCLTKCEIIYFEFQELIKLVEEDKDLNRFYRKAMEHYLIKLETSTIRYATSNASQRYLLLKKEVPSIEKFVAQYHIASHLGITPVQLSRIRKNLLKRN